MMPLCNFTLIEHTAHKICIYTRREPLLISSWLPLGIGPPLRCRAEILTGPALHQIEALLSELRRTLSELRCTLSELRCTLSEVHCILKSELRPTLDSEVYAAPSILSYAAPTVKLLPTISELRCTLADEEILMKVDVQS